MSSREEICGFDATEFGWDQARRNQRYCLSNDSIGIFWGELRLMDPSLDRGGSMLCVVGLWCGWITTGLISWYGVGSTMPVELEVQRTLRDLVVFRGSVQVNGASENLFQTTEVWCKPLLGC